MVFFSFMKSTGSSRKLGHRPSPTLPMSLKRPGPLLVQDQLLRVRWGGSAGLAGALSGAA